MSLCPPKAEVTSSNLVGCATQNRRKQSNANFFPLLDFSLGYKVLVSCSISYAPHRQPSAVICQAVWLSFHFSLMPGDIAA